MLNVSNTYSNDNTLEKMYLKIVLKYFYAQKVVLTNFQKNSTTEKLIIHTPFPSFRYVHILSLISYSRFRNVFRMKMFAILAVDKLNIAKLLIKHPHTQSKLNYTLQL